MLRKQIAREPVISVGEDRPRTAVAALGNVMRQTGNDDASETSHAIGWRRMTVAFN
jgi:hypothetical protein